MPRLGRSLIQYGLSGGVLAKMICCACLVPKSDRTTDVADCEAVTAALNAPHIKMTQKIFQVYTRMHICLGNAQAMVSILRKTCLERGRLPLCPMYLVHEEFLSKVKSGRPRRQFNQYNHLRYLKAFLISHSNLIMSTNHRLVLDQHVRIGRGWSKLDLTLEPASTGGEPPSGEAISTSKPASVKIQYGAAASSSQ